MVSGVQLQCYPGPASGPATFPGCPLKGQGHQGRAGGAAVGHAKGTRGGGYGPKGPYRPVKRRPSKQVPCRCSRVLNNYAAHI